MAKNVQLTIDIKGNDSVGKAAEKTKTLKTQLRELKAELASGNLVGKAFDDAAIKAGQLEDAIKDVNQRVNNLSSDTQKLDGFLDLAQGITGGFAAAQGAMALFGSENEDLQKQLVKIQGAVALLNGVQQVANTLNKDSAAMTQLNIVRTKIMTAVQGRYAAVVGTTTGAMKLLRLAGAAIPITLLITGIGILIANFDKIKKVVLSFLPGLGQLGDLFTKVKNAVMDFVGISSEAERQEEKAAKQRAVRSQQMQYEIELMEANGASARELYLAKRKLLFNDLETLKIAAFKKDATQEEIKGYNDMVQAIRVLDAEETTRLKDGAEKEKEASKKAQEKRKADNDKKIEEEKRVEEEIRKLKEDEAEKQRLRGKSDFELELMELQKQAEQKLELVKNDLEAQKLIRDNYQKDADTLNEKYRLQQEEKDKEIKAKKDEQDLADKEAERLRIQELADFELQTKQNLEDAKLGIANQSAQFLQAIAGKQKGIALAALAIEKGAAIADVIIQGQRANAKLTALYPAPANVPFIAANNIRTALSVATIAATGIQGAKNISSGGGSGSGGGSVQPPNIRGSQTTNEQPTPQPTKVFVTETDIRSSMRKIDGIYTQSTII